MRVDVCVIQLQWVKHQEVGRLKEWQLVSVTLMLNVVHRYSQQHFYNLHPTKTNIVEFNKQNNIENSWKLEGKNLCTTITQM
jgi:hypothetical protein